MEFYSWASKSAIFAWKIGVFFRPEICERGGVGVGDLGASMVYDLFGSELIGGGYICGPTIKNSSSEMDIYLRSALKLLLMEFWSLMGVIWSTEVWNKVEQKA